MMFRHSACAVMVVLSLTGSARAQQTPAPIAPSATPPGAPVPPGEPKGDRPPKPSPVPTLDELLGLPADGARPGPGASPDVLREDLNKRLLDENPAELFEQAVALMDSTATRLDPQSDGAAGDTGLETQRLQEDTLRKLDAMIAQMRKQRQQQQQQRQQQQSPQDQQQQRQQQQQQQQQSARQDQATESANIDPPSRRDGALRPGLDAAKAAWGALPARIRDLLLQGSGEKFSTSYERMTEEYYRKLAEQKP